MAYSIILMQEERNFTVPAGGSIIQGEASAANVAPYHLVTPFIRIKSSPAPSIPTSLLVLNFYSAAVLNYPDESIITGERFVGLQASPAPIATIALNGVGAGTYSLASISTGGLNAILNPGALLLWQLQNGGSTTAIFTGDIYLVCRGY